MARQTWRFSLRSMLLLVAVIAVVLGAGERLGWAILGVLLLHPLMLVLYIGVYKRWRMERRKAGR